MQDQVNTMLRAHIRADVLIPVVQSYMTQHALTPRTRRPRPAPPALAWLDPTCGV